MLFGFVEGIHGACFQACLATIAQGRAVEKGIGG